MLNNKCLRLFTLGLSVTISSTVVFSLIDRERYEYLLFENVERTKLVNIEEQKTVQKLKVFRFRIYQIKDKINCLLGRFTYILHKRHISRLLQVYSLLRLIKSTVDLVAFEQYIEYTKYLFTFRNIERIISVYGSADDIMVGAKKLET